PLSGSRLGDAEGALVDPDETLGSGRLVLLDEAQDRRVLVEVNDLRALVRRTLDALLEDDVEQRVDLDLADGLGLLGRLRERGVERLDGLVELRRGGEELRAGLQLGPLPAVEDRLVLRLARLGDDDLAVGQLSAVEGHDL